MTDFDTRFAARGFPKLLDRFGERIVYRPRGGTPRNIDAIVNRNPASQLSEMEGGVAPVLTIEAKNDEQDGIASHLWSSGDQVLVAVRVGGAEEWRTMTEMMPDHDGSTCEFTVR